MQRLALMVALGCLTGNAAGQTPVDARKLVGVWEVRRVNGQAPGDAGGTMLLAEDGKMIASPDGLKGAALEGTYTLEGDQFITRFHGFQGGDLTTTSTVKRLTSDRLVLVDQAKQEIEYRRKRK